MKIVLKSIVQVISFRKLISQYFPPSFLLPTANIHTNQVQYGSNMVPTNYYYKKNVWKAGRKEEKRVPSNHPRFHIPANRPPSPSTGHRW